MDKHQRLADDRSERELKLVERGVAVLFLAVRGIDHAPMLPKIAQDIAD